MVSSLATYVGVINLTNSAALEVIASVFFYGSWGMSIAAYLVHLTRREDS